MYMYTATVDMCIYMYVSVWVCVCFHRFTCSCWTINYVFFQFSDPLRPLPDLMKFLMLGLRYNHPSNPIILL